MTRLSEAILNNTRGVILTLADVQIVSVLRHHVDFFVADCAARRMSPEVVEKLLAAAGDTPFLVRAENSRASTLQSYLNMGVDGLIIPDIQFATEAEKIIASCLFPPEGIRPYRANASTRFGLSSDVSLPALNDQVTFLIDIAHPQTIAQLEELAEVSGVDGFLVNPERLAVSLEKNMDIAHHDVVQALQRIQSVAGGFDIPFGWEGDMSDNQTANFQIVTSDIQLLSAGAKAYFPVDAVQDEEETDLINIRAIR